MEELHELAKKILPYTIHLAYDVPGIDKMHCYLSHCCFTTIRVMALVGKREKPSKRLDELIHEITNSINHVFFVDCFDEALNIGHSFTVICKDDRFGIIHSNLNESYQTLEEMELDDIISIRMLVILFGLDQSFQMFYRQMKLLILVSVKKVLNYSMKYSPIPPQTNATADRIHKATQMHSTRFQQLTLLFFRSIKA